MGISWGKGGINLYLNDTLVESVPYVAPSPNWTSASNFDLGAYEYFTFGGYDASDDLIDELLSTPSTPPMRPASGVHAKSQHEQKEAIFPIWLVIGVGVVLGIAVIATFVAWIGGGL